MQNLFLWIAIGLIGLSTSQFFIAGLQAQRIDKRLRSRQSRRLKKLRSATRVARMTSELDATSQTLQGNHWRVVEVVRVVDESADTKSFTLADPYQQDLPSFHPGQYLLVRPAIAGTYQTTRCYSLSGPPNPRVWRITVKKQASETPPRPDRKTGGLSFWLHENIQEGDCLLVGGPGGQFYLGPEERGPLVLMAAGVGITPMNSMLHYSISHTPDRPVSLHYQVKDLLHWPLGREVHACAGLSNHCRVVTMVSRPDASINDLEGRLPGEFRHGRVDPAHVVADTNSAEAHYYLCGPETWMQQMRTGLVHSGVPENQIHWESFGGGRPYDLVDSKRVSKETKTHSVEFRRSNIQVNWDTNQQSLWELAQANDLTLPSGCLSGVCGSCRVRVLKGRVRYDRVIHLSLPENECLSCVAQPVQDLVIDA